MVNGYIQSIIGATENRRDSAGLDSKGLEWVFWTILLNVFIAWFKAFSGVLTVSGSGTWYHFKTDAYHFPYGDDQGEKTGRWHHELHGSNTHQARRSRKSTKSARLSSENRRVGLNAMA